MRITAGLLGLAALGLLILLSLQRGAADLHAFGTRHGLDGGKLVLSREGLEQAIRLDGGNPEHHEYLARLEELGGEYRRALERYRVAAGLRPGSPGAWGHIGRMKLRLGELDAELDSAITKAARLGPWEPDVQLMVAALAMESSQGLAPEARRAAFAAIGNALKRQERELVQLAERRGRLDLLCSLPGIAAYPWAARRCI